MVHRVSVGDAYELGLGVGCESVALILTDPVYNDMDQYRWLAEWAMRVLVPGGSVIAQMGQYYLPQVYAIFEASPLNYVWPLNETMHLNSTLWERRVVVKHKPYIWYSKGPRNGGFVFDVIRGGGRSKSHHVWQDSPAAYVELIARLTEPGDLVADPFLGGGTTLVSCKLAGRDGFGFEIDPERAAAAQRRIDETPTPLIPVEQTMEQPSLFEETAHENDTH